MITFLCDKLAPADFSSHVHGGPKLVGAKGRSDSRHRRDAKHLIRTPTLRSYQQRACHHWIKWRLGKALAKALQASLAVQRLYTDEVF